MPAVITGTGMITSVGTSTAACFEALCQGTSGNKPLQAFDQAQFNLKRAYEIADRPFGEGDRKGRATKWLCAVVDQAIAQSGITPGKVRMAALVGTGLRELRSLELWWANAERFNIDELDFSAALLQSVNLQGPVVTLSNACAASSFALGIAADLLDLGEAEAVIVAGCDSITESMFGSGDRASMLHPDRVQPFDQARRGALLGEGAAAVILESTERASARGALPLAHLRGVGMSCDAFHETAPEQSGMVRAMIDAHQRANLGKDDLDLLLAHGTGTELNDRTEALAIHEVFGDAVARIRITAIKSMIGHTSGASGLIGVVTAIECMRQGKVPPTIGFTSPAEEAQGLDIVTGAARLGSFKAAQVNAFGFGGVNAVVILEKPIQ